MRGWLQTNFSFLVWTLPIADFTLHYRFDYGTIIANKAIEPYETPYLPRTREGTCLRKMTAAEREGNPLFDFDREAQSLHLDQPLTVRAAATALTRLLDSTEAAAGKGLVPLDDPAATHYDESIITPERKMQRICGGAA